MKNQQRIYNAAKHAFLKFGYYGTTIEQIAKYAGSGKAMVHYYFRSKERLYELVLTEFIKGLFEQLNRNKEFKSHPYEQGIEYPETFEIAWFIANEFKSNKLLAHKIIRQNNELRSIFKIAYNKKDWVVRFQNLITAQLKDIFIKNNLNIS